MASLESALGIKSPAVAGRSRAFFKLFTVRELARKLGRGEDERHTISARMGCSTRRNGSNTSPEDLEGDDPEQRLRVARLAEDDRCMTLALRQPDEIVQYQ